jgi:WhiB family redox-sensing transcriptional regulator
MTIGLLRETIINTETWVDHAICSTTDPELFFPSSGDAAPQAKRICQVCPVRKQCLDYALKYHEPVGIWGGLSPRERMDFRRGKLKFCEHGGRRGSCRECARVRDAAYRKRIREGQSTNSKARHGTISRYGQGCRCGDCRIAKSRSNAAHYAKQRPRAS